MINIKIFKNKKEIDTNKKITISKKQWPDHVESLNDKSLEKFIQKYPISVVDFWAPWCNPCKTLKPRIRRLANIYKGEVAFGKINIQDNKNSAKKYKIASIPSLIFFSHGKKIMNITGVKTVGEIKEIVNEILKKNKR